MKLFVDAVASGEGLRMYAHDIHSSYGSAGSSEEIITGFKGAQHRSHMASL